MKFRTLILFAIQLGALSLAAQKDGETWRITEAGTITTSFENTRFYKTHKLPFRKIIVVDKRFDSSKTGYANVLTGKTKYSKIILKDSWSTIINDYFKNNLDSASTQSLVIIIKSYWLQKGLFDEMVHKKIIQKDLFGITDYGGSCWAAIDTYVQTDSTLQALFKIDTSFINFINFRKKRIDEFFFLPFDSIANKIASIDVSEMLARRRNLSWNEVNDYYNNRFNLPILTSEIKKGVFLTFADFKNNKPLVTDLTFGKSKLTTELYIVNNGKEELVADYWGFFDGKSLYVKAGFNAFKAVKQQNTFEFFGAKHISNYQGRSGSGNSQHDIRVNSYGMDEKVLQVNMDNGRIF